MAAYAQFGYNYPSASQLLTSGSQSTTGVSGASAQSPSLSPSGGSATATTAVTSATATSGGVAQLGALSPGSLSQTSTNHGPVSMGGNGGAGGLSSGVPTGAGGNGQSTCCENGRPIMTDPVSGQTVCSCQYDSARLALSAGYAASRMPSSAGVGVYGTPYPSTDQNPYPSIGVDSSAFYSPLSNPYGLKESSGTTGDMSAWTSAGLQPTTGYYPYDPTLAAYGYGAGYDLAARRKNATRESTATLKAWLNEHKKNPYPTKGEKIMLAIITKMTLTQVSTWFANARRRLKKENKMTWEPKNKTDDDDDAMLSDEDKDKDDMDHPGHMDKQRDHKESMHHVKSEQHIKDEDEDDLAEEERAKLEGGGMSGHHHHHLHHQHHHHQAMQQPHDQQGGHHHLSQQHQHHQYQSGLHPYHNAHGHPYSPYSSSSSASAAAMMYHPGAGGAGQIKEEEMTGNSSISKNQTSSDCGVPLPASKPKIWSLADTAACKTPPHPLYPMGMHHHEHHHHLGGGHPGHHHHHNPHQQQMQEHQHSQGNPWDHHQQQHHQQQPGDQQHYQQSQHMDQQLHPGGSGMGSNLAAMQGLADSLSANGGDGSSPVPNFQEAPHQMASPGNGLMLQYNNTAYNGRAPPSGFLGGSRHFSHMSSDTSSSTTSSYSHSPHMSALTGPPATSATPPSQQNPLSSSMGQQLGLPSTTLSAHRSSSNGSSSSSQSGMCSFPELQTDTPPQTPPNMKLPSVAGTLLTAATGTCYSRKGQNQSQSQASQGFGHMPSSPSSNGSAGAAFGTANPGGDSDNDSFKTSSSTSSSSGGGGSASPFFKSGQVGNVAGYVAPV